MPARGTHSLESSLRGRGLRFEGSWAKVERTQSAIASADMVMVLSDGSSGEVRVGGGGVGEPG